MHKYKICTSRRILKFSHIFKYVRKDLCLMLEMLNTILDEIIAYL